MISLSVRCTHKHALAAESEHNCQGQQYWRLLSEHLYRQHLKRKKVTMRNALTDAHLGRVNTLGSKSKIMHD